jgi:hypothetical protein
MAGGGGTNFLRHAVTCAKRQQKGLEKKFEVPGSNLAGSQDILLFVSFSKCLIGIVN